MNPKSQKRAVLVLRMDQWNEEEAARTREALTVKLAALGVAPEAIEVQEWRGLDSTKMILPQIEPLLARIHAGELHFVAVRDTACLIGRDPRIVHLVELRLAMADGALVTQDASVEDIQREAKRMARFLREPALIVF